jgi:hypothetical protein
MSDTLFDGRLDALSTRTADVPTPTDTDPEQESAAAS